jgi:hypothetical protein
MRKQCFEQQWCFVSIDELPNDHMASHQKTDLASKGNSSNSPQNRVSTFYLMAPPLLKALFFGLHSSNDPQNRALKLVPMENDI